MRNLFLLFFFFLTGYNSFSQHAANAFRISENFNIDGQLTEPFWNNVEKNMIDSVYSGDSVYFFIDTAYLAVYRDSIITIDTITSIRKSDLTGYWKAIWNDTGIIIGVMVYDSIHYPGLFYSTSSWKTDKVEVYFDMNTTNLKDGVGASGYGGHYQFAENADSNSTPLYWMKDVQLKYHLFPPIIIKADPIHYIKADTIYYQYSFELYVPWTLLVDYNGSKFTPDGYTAFGFDVNLCDYDTLGWYNNDTVTWRVFKRRVWANKGVGTGPDWEDMDSAGLLTCVNYCCVTDIKSGLNDSQNTIRVYPNPFINQVRISNLKSGNAEVYIYNMQGKIILRRTISNNGTINLSSLQSGIYIFKVIEQNDTRAFRLIKK
jgi:hypothetical protein